MSNESILRSCENHWLDPDYEYSKAKEKEYERCDFCHELVEEDECITYCGRTICMSCAEEISEILEEMREGCY